MALILRPAEARDADRLGTIHVLAWQAAYRGVMTDAFLDSLDPDGRAASWRSALTEPRTAPAPDGTDPPSTLVAELEGRVVAMASVGHNRSTAEAPDVTGELWMLNADPAAWGTGAATALHRGACAELARLGHTAVVLWVGDRNLRARRFYEREGWSFDGESRSERIGGADVEELRYRREVK